MKLPIRAKKTVVYSVHVTVVHYNRSSEYTSNGLGTKNNAHIDTVCQTI